MQTQRNDEADDAVEVFDSDEANDDAAIEDRGDELSPAEGHDAATRNSQGSGDDSEGPDAAGGADDDAAKREPPMIPKSRFDEVNEQRKWLQRQVEQLNARGEAGAEQSQQAEQSNEPEPFDFDAAEDQYMEAMYNGDKDDAKKIRRQINEENRNLAIREASQHASQNASQREQMAALNNTAAAIVEQYPFLNSESDAADNEAITEVVDFREMYMARGDTPAEALRKAAARVGPQYQAKGQDAAPGNAGKGANGGDRAAAARRRNAEAANRQPPAMAGVGARGAGQESVSVESMSDEEFSNLSAAEKSRLRGD